MLPISTCKRGHRRDETLRPGKPESSDGGSNSVRAASVERPASKPSESVAPHRNPFMDVETDRSSSEISRDSEVEVVAFLKGRSVPCPRCAYDLRDIPTATCPECAEPLVLKIGSPRTRFGWLVLAMVPGCFSGVAALFVMIPIFMTIWQRLRRVRALRGRSWWATRSGSSARRRSGYVPAPAAVHVLVRPPSDGIRRESLGNPHPGLCAAGAGPLVLAVGAQSRCELASIHAPGSGRRPFYSSCPTSMTYPSGSAIRSSPACM